MTGQNPGLRLRCLRHILLALALSLGGCAEWRFVTGESSVEATREAAAIGDSDYERGKSELAAGRLGLAVLHFRAALARTPDSVEALNGLGAAFDRLGRYDLSARLYGRALAIDPTALQTLNNLGYSYLLQGRHELAVAYLRDASARAGADARILENRRMAEIALAKAGGPALRHSSAPGAMNPDPGAPYKPRILRTGKGLRHLVTRPPKAGADGGALPAVSETARRHGVPLASDLLPAYLAAPMALDETWLSRPVLGAGGG